MGGWPAAVLVFERLRSTTVGPPPDLHSPSVPSREPKESVVICYITNEVSESAELDMENVPLDSCNCQKVLQMLWPHSMKNI